MNEIETVYLRYPVHPNISEIRVGPGIERIVRTGDSLWVYGTPDGPLAGKAIEIPSDNVAAIQWKLAEASAATGA